MVLILVEEPEKESEKELGKETVKALETEKGLVKVLAQEKEPEKARALEKA